MRATANDHCLVYFFPTSTQVYIVTQPVKRQHTIEVLSRNMSRKTPGYTTGGDQKRPIAKAAFAIQVDNLALRVDLLDSSMNHPNILIPLSPDGIRKELL